MHSVGWKLKTVYMPFSLMVFHLGFWGGGIYNLLFPFLLLEYKNMFFVCQKVNFQFIICQRNHSAIFFKAWSSCPCKDIWELFPKECFELHLYNGGWSTVLPMAGQKQNLPLPESHWWSPLSFGVEVRNAVSDVDITGKEKKKFIKG